MGKVLVCCEILLFNVYLTPPKMGALVTKALRPLKSFNIENRAHRVISKEKPVPAPKYPGNIDDIKRAIETDPDLNNKLSNKDPELDDRLRDVYVTSHGKPEDDITRQRKQGNPNRPLPQDRKIVDDFDFGFKEPDRIPYGQTTIRHVVNFISAHQSNPEEVTAAKIAFEYKMREEDVVNILKYFKTYEIYLPETKTSQAVFAGPATSRKQLLENNTSKIVDRKGIDESKEKVETKDNKSR